VISIENIFPLEISILSIYNSYWSLTKMQLIAVIGIIGHSHETQTSYQLCIQSNTCVFQGCTFAAVEIVDLTYIAILKTF
ncbi:MAG TPA: hypothetical protein VFJ51_07860, partial [Nitrososphaeraceae archaeon]|nr:hypothetical protein [Nitrososphaeraceae archaeon]